ncbi:MAG: OB-fold domain-containing protein [Pigmentiphaga sp.]|uniref:Zn-ribbon domain-containing OB-fold protein n=1 Tax=Pigmentiphaga sp. TaxID=1977564 RepID=UPI0029A34BDB|nr:OB-fold domain-containing protein [Pigmentiphaga sp.]MDX3906188.1 OB-fold domain-containing protein [Pigmentiphaga sp.]
MTRDTSPAPASPLAVFRDYLARGELAYQYDAARNRPVFHPRVIGPGSGNPDLQWRVSAGTGTVYAVTVISPRGEDPYNVVLVDMDEGFRLMSRVDGVPPDEVRIGMRVRAEAHQPGDGQPPYPIFRPEAA